MKIASVKSDTVLIEPIQVEEKTAGGIIVPEAASEKPVIGTVVQVGKNVEDVDIGQVVLYNKYAGTEVPVGSSKMKLLSIYDILAVIED
jgi:chaperonin GroES